MSQEDSHSRLLIMCHGTDSDLFRMFPSVIVERKLMGIENINLRAQIENYRSFFKYCCSSTEETGNHWPSNQDDTII